LETWSESAIGDIMVGMRYQYHKSDSWRLAFTGGILLPTGDPDDPDILTDLDFGTGTTAIMLNFNHDYMGIENATLNATFRYEIYLPDEEKFRILTNVDQPLVPSGNTEKVDRDLGDVIEVELAGNYSLSDTWSAHLVYKFGMAFKDKIDGDMFSDYSAMEDQTDYEEHVILAGISYSTISLYMDDKFKVPFAVSLNYRDRFAGKNGVNNSQYLGLGLTMYF
jgi:hypothetical protein